MGMKIGEIVVGGMVLGGLILALGGKKSSSASSGNRLDDIARQAAEKARRDADAATAASNAADAAKKAQDAARAAQIAQAAAQASGSPEANKAADDAANHAERGTKVASVDPADRDRLALAFQDDVYAHGAKYDRSALRVLQSALGVAPDGDYGPITQGALTAGGYGNAVLTAAVKDLSDKGKAYDRDLMKLAQFGLKLNPDGFYGPNTRAAFIAGGAPDSIPQPYFPGPKGSKRGK